MFQNEMKTFVQDLLTNKKNDGSASTVLDPQFNDSADDGSQRTFGFQIDSMLENVDKWQQRLEIYMEDEEDDLRPDEWKALEESLNKFHNDVLKRFGENAGEGLHSIPSDLYALEAIEAIKLMKRIKWKVTDAFDEICFDDAETEVKRILNKIVDKAVLSVDGGRSFERTEIDWVDPIVDHEFNKELYDFASANKSLPDAQAITWLPPVHQDAPKQLPRDILKRLTTPLKIGDVDDHEDWEYSVTHPPDEEESYERFEGPFQQLRKNLKDVLTNEILNYANKVDTTASIDPVVVEVASKRLEAGEMDFDFKSMIILPYDTNHCKLVGVRDDSVGDMLTYKEVLKPPSERIMDKKLQSDPGSWLDPQRPAGPRIRTFGWEPLADVKEELPCDETEIIKKKENPDALTAGSSLSAVAKERAELLVHLLKEKCIKAIEEKKFSCDAIANPSIKDYLQRKGQSFGIIPENFDTPEDFLDSLDMPILREKDAGKAFPLEDEVIPLDPEWLGLDGSGPHVPLTEELYWNQLQSFKKPLSVPSVDWKALLDQDVLEDEDGANTAELRRYLAEATGPLTKDVEVKPPELEDLTKFEKDTPARKRALDKEFVREWIDKFGNDEGIQGLDPKNFKPPEHLISSEEYDEKFLTHPYTSSYAFHPNFVRFRRMTRNHPTYSEYTFKKFESDSTLATEDNLREFKTILSDLDKDGPQISMDNTQQINEKNLGVDADQARKWEMEFSTHMTEGLSLLESFAETSRTAYSKPEQPCEEEMSEDLLFGRVEKQELPDCFKEFRLQPFCLEDFPKFPAVGAANDVIVGEEKPKISSTSPDSGSESEESDDEMEVTRKDLPWRPFRTFNSYKSVNLLQLLFDAGQLIETSTPKRFHPPPKVSAWIQGKYQPSTIKLKKWRKLYGSLFPKVDSSLKTPYLFLSEEEKLDRLRKSDSKDCKNPDDAWALTEEERLSLENPSKKAEDIDKAQDAAGDDKVSLMELRSGIVVQSNKNTQKWAVELDTSEAPDMSVLGTPAMEFMFQLDNFQKQAIMALEKGYNVFVSAHTSAGKTVVAEYAIAMSRKRRSRAIYTSPIKALSNQKYKDFKKCFDSVGLITGDVQLNERADCLIMTTEILRSMLYNSSEGIRDLEFVVLDEVHYMNDRERGHVWEEVLILLPANVQIVMLSATVPNAMEFASWVGRNKERKVKVCRTLHRPVPLKHYFYVGLPGKCQPDDGLFLLRDGDGPVLKHVWGNIKELTENVEKAINAEKKAALRKLSEKRALMGKKFKESSHQDHDQPQSSGSGYNRQDAMNFYLKKERDRWLRFILYLKDRSWLPTIVFAFSRKKCDELADLLKEIDLTTAEEKLCITVFIQSQVAKLDKEDRNLPQIRVLRSHLIRGIGVHHSGILPVLKEIVELLFQEGKVKLLLATETFAMGVNMPARTVVFYSIMKFDGGEKRFLLPAEYIQMAGRAGRRGEDPEGNVIIAYHPRDTVRSIEIIEAMMTGSPQTLTSQFRVSYRMILRTLTARSHITAENMMKRSYHENTEQNKYFLLEDHLRLAKDMENKQGTVINSLYSKDYVTQMREMYNKIDEYLTLWSELRDAESTTTKFLKEVQVGKLIKFRFGPIPAAIGVVMRVAKKPLEFLVMGLRNFDRNAILEPQPEIHDAVRWFEFLSMLPYPKVKNSDDELDMRLLTYKIKVSDILEIYKDSSCVTEENAPLLITNAQHANIGGRSHGFPSERGTVVVEDSCGHPLNLYCMPYPSPRNLPPFNPGIQANVAGGKFSNLSQTSHIQMKDFPRRAQPSSPTSPGNQGSIVGVTINNQHHQRELTAGNSLYNNPLFYQLASREPSDSTANTKVYAAIDVPRFERSQSVPGVNQPVSHQHPLVGPPLMYRSALPPRFPGVLSSPMYRPDFNRHSEMWNVSPHNVPSSYRHNHSVPYVSQTSHHFHKPNLNLAPTPVGSFHNQHHPGFQFISPNLQQGYSNHGNKAVCRPPLLENEMEFPKLGSRLGKDKKCTVGPQKPDASADSVGSFKHLSPELSQEREQFTNSTRDKQLRHFGSNNNTKMPESSDLLRQNSCPGSVEDFSFTDGILEKAARSCGVSSSQSTIVRPDVQACGPYPGIQPFPLVLALPPQHASPAYRSPTFHLALGPHGIAQPTAGSQVSRNPHNVPSPIPAAYCPNFTIPHPAAPRPFGPPNPFWRPPFPLNPALVYDPRHMTKSDRDLEGICYQLRFCIGLKPVDEAALAKECALELYENMKIKEKEMNDFIEKFYATRTREEFVESFAKIFNWLETVKKKDKLQKDVAEKTMTLYPEYSKKIEILEKMNYVANDSVQMKGYMAARINKCELVITEMLVRNVIKDLTPEEVAGLMSFIVYQSKMNPKKDKEEEEEDMIAKSRPNLKKAIENTLAIIGEIKFEELCVLGTYSEELEDLTPEAFRLTDIMYQWACQKSFAKVVNMAEGFQEGRLVRWIQQLVEALNEIGSAARVMGDPAVPEKIQAAIKSIKRGIVFSPSLYTTL